MLEVVVEDVLGQAQGCALMEVTLPFQQGPDGLIVQCAYLGAEDPATGQWLNSAFTGSGSLVHLCRGPARACSYTQQGYDLLHVDRWRRRKRGSCPEAWISNLFRGNGSSGGGGGLGGGHRSLGPAPLLGGSAGPQPSGNLGLGAPTTNKFGATAHPFFGGLPHQVAPAPPAAGGVMGAVAGLAQQLGSVGGTGAWPHAGAAAFSTTLYF